MNGYFEEIFSVSDEKEFEILALRAFHYQVENNPVYAEFVKYLKRDISQVNSLRQIPFLPIEFFKTKKVFSEQETEAIIFTSSGTTGMQVSKHYVKDLKNYESSFINCFRLFYGDIKQYCVLALLPSYLEREGSSLVYMADRLIKDSNNSRSGFYLHDLDALIKTIEELKAKKQRVLLLGVSYALMDLADKGCELNENFIVMETGGMKGKRREMLKDELHEYLSVRMGINKIHSEYGMTELLSQAYSKGDGIYQCPPWMKVQIREVSDPLSTARVGKTGGINVIDLANLYSCPFIATQDLGRLQENGNFEIIGRFDNSDVRGCNLLVQ